MDSRAGLRAGRGLLLSGVGGFCPDGLYPVRMGPLKRGHGEGEYTALEGGKVRWRVRVRYPDGSTARPSGTARNMTAARKEVQAAKAEAEAGRRPVALALTVSQMVTEYMEAKRARWADRTAWNSI